MAVLREAEEASYDLSLFKTSTALTIAGAAVGGALVSCATSAILFPESSVVTHLLQGTFVAIGAGIVGFLSARDLAKTVSVDDVEIVSEAVRSLLRDPDLVQRIPVANSGPIADLTSNLNVLIDSVAARQRALHETVSDVRAMRDRSESASMAKSHFLANMSHELRTPLNAIIGYAMLLQEDAQDAGSEEAVSDLDRILRAARHLLMLINDILDLSKIEAGKDEVEYSPVHVRTLIEETMAAVGPRTSMSDVRFELDLPDEEIYMQTDNLKVRQCLLNLLSNAFKFTRQGHVKLTVRIRDLDFGPVVEFAVEDTGIGISSEKIDGLFDAFVQENVSTTQNFGGTGLGLTITHKLTSLLGGQLSVDSEKDEGSVFKLTIPQEPGRKTSIRSLEELAATIPAVNDTQSERIALVIDDDASTVDLLSRWLKKQGYSVAAAYDGEAGLEVAQEFNPDLILLDIHMPRKNGWDVLEKLKEDENLRDVPVIVVSVDDNRRRGLSSGASEFLTKPTTQESLADVLNTFNSTADGQILVIDDDEDAGNIIERAARQVGLEVSRAYDGVAGLEMVRRHKPSAIVLDLTMPEKDGFSVLKELESDPELRRIPVIVVSARTLNGAEYNQIAESGCDFHAKGVSSPHDIAANLISVVNE